jgi:hypothetical protein
MIAVRNLTKKEILELVKHYLEAEKETQLATYRCGVSVKLLKHRDNLKIQLENLINNQE